MRRSAALFVAPLLVLLAAACGSNSSSGAPAGSTPTATPVTATPAAASASMTPTAAATGPVGTPTVTGGFGVAPVITIPAGRSPSPTLAVTVLHPGTGPVVSTGQTITVNYTGVVWRTGKAFDSTFDPSFGHTQPFATPIGVGAVVAGWDEGLVGKHVGSRVLLVIPPAQGYGPSGQSQAGIEGTDTMVFVVDIVSAV